MHTVSTTWHYRYDRPYKGDTIKEDRRLYIHYYFDIERAAEEEKRFDKRLMELRDELLSDQPRKEHEALYSKYFTLTRTPKRGIKVQVNEEAVAKSKRYYGFFALISNEKMHAKEALQIYRNKDVVEKAFGNLKERLNLRRLLVSSEQALEGKLFVAFIALIFLSYIKKQMQEANLFKTYTIGTLFDKLDVIECFEVPGHRLRVGEVLKKQRDIYAALGIEPPGSL
jgi:transposase